MGIGASPPLVWAVHDGKVGMASQVLGLAEAVGWPFAEKRLDIRAPWSHLAPPLWFRPLAAVGPGGDRLEPPWPGVLIGCGRNAVAPALAVKRASGGRTFWVHIQDPRFGRHQADLLVVPSHDSAKGANVITTLGAVHRVTAARLADEARRLSPLFAALPRPLVAVLIGGDNRVYRFTRARQEQLADQLAALGRSGMGLAITPSRRTDAGFAALLRSRLEGMAYIWDGSGENPYFAMLGLADAIVVTADSVNMVSEAASTGKPVHVVELDGGSEKFARFHHAMAEAGITRPFRGTIENWTYRPLDEAARAAAMIRERLAAASRRGRLMALRVALFLASFLVLCGATVALSRHRSRGERALLRPGARLFSRRLAARPAHSRGRSVSGRRDRHRRRCCSWHGGAGARACTLLLALALGPGLVVNVVFKDHWGRARPAQIAAFGGTQRFTPPFVPSDQCATNCSFPAGDPAMGFVLVAAAFLARPRRRRAAAAGALGLGAVLGIVRMAQGGHFFSDVLASGFLVFATSWALYRWIIVADGLWALRQLFAQPPPWLWRFSILTALTAVAFGSSYVWIDRPLATAFAAAGPRLLAFFNFVTMFGVSTGYLVAAALAAILLARQSARIIEPERKARLAAGAWRAAFVFVAIGAPGLFGDVLKPVFGRARPRLFLADGTFGFSWHGARAAYWSFPSGHSITIVALAVALTAIERRYLPLYVVAALFVMASRVALDQHYLSDVLAGAYIGGVGAWATAYAFGRRITDSP